MKSRPWMRKDKDVSHVTRSESKRRKVSPARGEDLERSEEDLSSMESDSAPDPEQEIKRSQKGKKLTATMTYNTRFMLLAYHSILIILWRHLVSKSVSNAASGAYS